MKERNTKDIVWSLGHRGRPHSTPDELQLGDSQTGGSLRVVPPDKSLHPAHPAPALPLQTPPCPAWQVVPVAFSGGFSESLECCLATSIDCSGLSSPFVQAHGGAVGRDSQSAYCQLPLEIAQSPALR